MKTAILPLFFFLLTLPVFLSAQGKKALDHVDVQQWKKIEQPRISNDGQWVAWVQVVVSEGDPELHLRDGRSEKEVIFPRGTEARFTEDNQHLIFRIKPSLDTLKAQRRRKVKDENLPKDTLAIYRLADATLEKISNLKSFAVPEKWSGWMAFQIETGKPAPAVKDTATDGSKVGKPDREKSTKKSKKEDKDNGYRLVVRNMRSGAQDTIAYVQEFVLAETNPFLLVHTTGKGDTLSFPANPKLTGTGVYWLDLEQNNIRPLFRGKGKYKQLALNKSGIQAAFLADTDTSKARYRPWQLCYWHAGQDSAGAIATSTSSFLPPLTDPQQATQPAKWMLSEDARPLFSEDGSKLYFGIAPPPILNDTTLLPEEIVNVEVWNWSDERLYTQQESRLQNEKKRSYPVVWHVRDNRFVQLGSPEVPELRFQEQRDAALALGFTEEPYARYVTWEGTAHKDLYAVDVNAGTKTRIVGDLRCNPRLSPAGKYIAWWSDPDTAWFAWNARTAAISRLSDNNSTRFFSEENDVPDYPNEYGVAGWLHDDAAILIYDKYDLWAADPEGKKAPQRLTRGREEETVYRYIKLDPEERDILPGATLLLHRFNDRTKAEGYAFFDLKKGLLTPWLGGDFSYTRQPLKAKNANELLFTKENYKVFPDLELISMPGAGKQDRSIVRRISNANPQQAEFNWGSVELVEWTALSGEKHQGLLVKPEGYDPSKQYPMIVNFYEKLSDGLYKHRAPEFHRSQINWTFYASRGYLVFAPDIHYRTGYPGECAYDAIVSGVAALIDKGLADPKRVALQGHSWGGYQAAYVVTRTNMFACAEAGAPVANMTSAYGGIRWESGLSRAFQYERQQSRIGGSLWEYPLRYLENSPLFSLDKVQTPLLILHNDKDGAVPWYQGIELFTALRRLAKPAWMLNYNGEPHWPVKLQNRIDFQVRMAQFFDHFLLGKPQPQWMQRGVGPEAKGILQGLEEAQGN